MAAGATAQPARRHVAREAAECRSAGSASPGPKRARPGPNDAGDRRRIGGGHSWASVTCRTWRSSSGRQPKLSTLCTRRALIHRDIKPGNIMMRPDGVTATLMDLGLAQVANETEGRLTRTRQFVGTLRYASPEQMLAVAAGSPQRRVQPWGDAVGTAGAASAVRATDETPTPELMQKIQIEEPGRVRRHNPEVPRDLAAVVDKCLQKDPKRRYAMAAELVGRVVSIICGQDGAGAAGDGSGAIVEVGCSGGGRRKRRRCR